jgi:hypothetical protein
MLGVIEAKRRALRDDKENLDITTDFALEPSSRANHTRRLRKRGQETEVGSKNSKRKTNAPPNAKWQASDADALDDLSSIRKVPTPLPLLFFGNLDTSMVSHHTLCPYRELIGGVVRCNEKVRTNQEEVVEQISHRFYSICLKTATMGQQWAIYISSPSSSTRPLTFLTFESILMAINTKVEIGSKEYQHKP